MTETRDPRAADAAPDAVPDAPDAAPDAGQKRLIDADAMRCSTTERDRTAAAISAAAGEGRLLVEEADERLGRVFAARYRHELTALTSDLPPPDRAGGWPAIALLARDQLAADVRRLFGGGDAAARRLRIIVACVAAALLFVAVAVAVIHGVVDGPELPGGRD